MTRMLWATVVLIASYPVSSELERRTLFINPSFNRLGIQKYSAQEKVLDTWQSRPQKGSSKKIKKPNIKDILGGKRVNSITVAKQINIYHVKEFVTDVASQNRAENTYFADYEVISDNKINPKKLKPLKKALLNPANYADLEYLNKCIFSATIGVELISKKDTMQVLISYPCKQILFIENGQELYRDLKSVAAIAQIAKEFLKDLPQGE